jgi:hypothetical protein
MSGRSNEGGLGTVIGLLLSAVIQLVVGILRLVFRLLTAGSVAAKRGAAERASRRQQQKWLEDVQRQMARGKAGNASEKDAQAALRGSGGRPSKFDDRWY